MHVGGCSCAWEPPGRQGGTTRPWHPHPTPRHHHRHHHTALGTWSTRCAAAAVQVRVGWQERAGVGDLLEAVAGLAVRQLDSATANQLAR